MQNELNKKRREANQLNARIDRLIAEEIEKARKRAAEEARREAAARKKAGEKPKKRQLPLRPQSRRHSLWKLTP